MWNVIYERHHKYLLDKSSKFATKHYLVAFCVFQWYKFWYFINTQPVKQVSIFRSENEVNFLKGSRVISRDPEQLRRLRWVQKNGRQRSPWDS